LKAFEDIHQKVGSNAAWLLKNLFLYKIPKIKINKELTTKHAMPGDSSLEKFWKSEVLLFCAFFAWFASSGRSGSFRLKCIYMLFLHLYMPYNSMIHPNGTRTRSLEKDLPGWIGWEVYHITPSPTGAPQGCYACFENSPC